jgi:hypothetical protein
MGLMLYKAPRPWKSDSRLTWVLLFMLVAALAADRVFGQPAPGFVAGPDPLRDRLAGRAHAAGIDPGAMGDMVLRGRVAGLSDEQLLLLGNRVIQIAEQGLPCLPVLNRVCQGFAKGAPFERIEAVCERIEGRLHEGAGLVDRAFPEMTVKPGGASTGPVSGARLGLIDQTAFALEKGVPPASIETIFSDFRGAGQPPAQARAVGSPLIAVTSLVSEGVPPGTCLEFVTEACRRGVCGPVLTDLSLAMARSIRSGGREEILQQVMNGLRQRVAPAEIIRRLPGGMPGAFPPPHPHPPGSPGPGAFPPAPPQGGMRPPDDPGRRGGHGEGRAGDHPGKR